MNAAAIDETSVKMFGKKLIGCLGGQEIARYESLDAQQQGDWLSGRLALKTAAIHRLSPQGNLTDIVIDNLPSGEPYILGQENLFCSIAHSHSWGVGAVSSQRIGVDIERIRPHAEDLLEYLADDREIDSLKNVFKDTSDLITVIWTVKESVLKGLGIGFGLSPKQLKIFSSENEWVLRVEVQPPEHASVWWVTLQKKDDFFISVASQQIHEKQEISWYNPVSL